jgi:hypothetical protein
MEINSINPYALADVPHVFSPYRVACNRGNSFSMNLARIRRRSCAIMQTIISNYPRYAQAVIDEDSLPAFGLHLTMGVKIAPALCGRSAIRRNAS